MKEKGRGVSPSKSHFKYMLPIFYWIVKNDRLDNMPNFILHDPVNHLHQNEYGCFNTRCTDVLHAPISNVSC